MTAVLNSREIHLWKFPTVAWGVELAVVALIAKANERRTALPNFTLMIQDPIALTYPEPSFD